MSDSDARATRPRRRLRLLWPALAAGVVLLTLVTIVATGTRGSAGELDPDSAAPDGARAVVEVLRHAGVSVSRADGLATALAGSGGTLFIDDRDDVLSVEQYRRLARSIEAIVLLQPSTPALDALAPSVAFAGAPVATGVVPADCAVGPAVRAGGIVPGGQAYRLLSPGGETCFPTGDGAAALVRTTASSGATVTVVGDPAVFRNDGIDEDGRAALALGLLGGTDRLTWYVPSALDAEEAQAPGFAELAPPWVTPALLLLVTAAGAAAVWRGRRFGPLVHEGLPVLVRASETAQGRGRLYARESARLRALDSLRIGAIGRLARALSLPRSADVSAVADAVAARLERDAGSVRRLLVEDEPASDADLVSAADALARLEADVRHSLAADAPRPPRPDQEAAR